MKKEKLCKKKLSKEEMKETLTVIKNSKVNYNVQKFFKMTEVINKYYPDFMFRGLFVEDILIDMLENTLE